MPGTPKMESLPVVLISDSVKITVSCTTIKDIDGVCTGNLENIKDMVFAVVFIELVFAYNRVLKFPIW